MRSDIMNYDIFVKRVDKWVKEYNLYNENQNLSTVIRYFNDQLDKELDEVEAKKIKGAILLLLRGEKDLDGHPLICACNTFEDIAHGQRKNFLRRGE